MPDGTAPQWTDISQPSNRHVYHVDSAIVGDRLEVTVIEPFPGAGQLPNLPALYVLDPIACLDVVSGVSRIYDIFSQGAVPFKYVVGIGYATLDVEPRRYRDLTPTAAALPPGIEVPLPLGTGGASRFLDALAGELIPGLEARHNLDPASRTLIGYSLSARFALYALFKNPELFQRYLIASPSFWWDGASIFDEERDYAAAHDDLAARVFLSVGEMEQQTGVPTTDWRSNFLDQATLDRLAQLQHTRKFIEALSGRHYPNLKLSTASFPGERHITVYPAAVARGLTELFPV